MENHQKYNIKVTWNVHYHPELQHADKEETEVVEFPTWLRLEKRDIDDDGIFYIVDKLSELDKETFYANYNVISAKLVRKLSIKEEISE